MEVDFVPLRLIWMGMDETVYYMDASDGRPKPHKNMGPWGKALFTACLLRVLRELEESDAAT